MSHGNVGITSTQSGLPIGERNIGLRANAEALIERTELVLTKKLNQTVTSIT